MRLFLGFLCLIGIITFTYPVWGQDTLCSTRDSWVEKLGTEYNETLRIVGVSSKGPLMEIFVSESGTYTIIMSMNADFSCAVSTGEGWHELVAPKAGTNS